MKRRSANRVRSIGSLAAALARAQVELINPEKSMVASIRPDDGTAEQIFHYAPLSSGLGIVRKTLGQHEIATVQTTSLDQTRPPPDFANPDKPCQRRSNSNAFL